MVAVSYRSGYSSNNTENREEAVKPVDYKDGEFSNHFSSEFHHIIGTAFFPFFVTIRISLCLVE